MTRLTCIQGNKVTHVCCILECKYHKAEVLVHFALSYILSTLPEPGI